MTLIRVLLHSTLSFALALPPLARAEMVLPGKLNRLDTKRFLATLDRLNQNPLRSYRSLSRSELAQTVRSGAKEALLYPASWAAHGGQTFTLLWILAAVEAVHQQERLRPVQSSETEKIKLLAQVGGQMINNYQIFSAMAGSSVIGTTLAQPLSTLDQLIKSSVTSPYLAKLLSHGAASFVTFIGWEAGSRLWQDALLTLDEADIKTAQNLRFMDMLVGKGTQEQERVFKKILNAAFEILVFAKPEMTRHWLYNTWRLNIATGEFITILTSMVTAGVTVGSLAPGAGQLVGLIFGFVGGLAGGAIAILIPQDYKTSLTDGLRRLRMTNGQNQLNANENELRHAAHYFASPLGGAALSEYHQNAFVKFLGARQALREDISTALSEQIYDSYVRYQEAELTLNLIQSAKKQKSVAITHEAEVKPIETLERQMKSQLNESRERMEFFFRELLEQQQLEASRMGAYLYKKGIPERIKDNLNRVIDEQSLIHSALRHLYAGIFPDKKYQVGLEDLSAEDLQKAAKGAQILLNLFYLQSFQEPIFLE